MLLLFLRPAPRERGCLPRLAGREEDELVRVGDLASSSRGGLEVEWVVAADGARLSPAADGSWSSSVSSESSESVSSVRKEAAVAAVDGWVGVCWRSLLGGGEGEGDGELRESRERVELAIDDDDDEQSVLNRCCVGKQRKRGGACARITFRVHPF
jgi:hypothetical protein